MTRPPTALVTGGASGIGFAVARRLRDDGWRVLISDINEPAAHEAARSLGADVSALAMDVGDPGSVSKALDEATKSVDGLDGLICAAGIEIAQALDELDPDAWQRTMQVNLTGPFLCLQAFLALLKEAGGAAVMVGSPTGRAAYPGASAYAGSKAGLEGFVRGAAIDCAPLGVRVNCVLPGTTDTPLLRGSVSGPELERLLEQAAASVPLGRVAEPWEIAAAVVFLLSDEARYVTGSSLVVDGGLLARLATDV